MKTTALALPAVLLLLFAMPTQAKVLVEEYGEADYEEQIEREFTVTGADKEPMKLTFACKANAAGGPRFRFYFYEKSPQGGWRQIKDLQLTSQKNIKKKEIEFPLPAGDYMVMIKIRRMDYAFKLEHDVPDGEEQDGEEQDE